MSWAAHELESYVLQKHVNAKISYLAILLGCLLPDLFTKLPVYGWSIGSFTLKADFPAQYHRSWPGVGFTHSLFFGALVALLLLFVTKNRAWALGLLVGQWAHVLTDTFDSVGTMLFFPFTTQHYSTGMWAYAAQAGRYGDSAAYYSSLGGVWDVLWLGVAVSSPVVFRRTYFFEKVVTADPAWGWLQRRFDLSERAMVAMYRAWFVYGACRIFAWFGWSRFLNPNRGTQTLDWTWGGPRWVEAVSFPARSWEQFFVSTGWGLVALTAALFGVWRLVGRRLWLRAV